MLNQKINYVCKCNTASAVSCDVDAPLELKVNKFNRGAVTRSLVADTHQGSSTSARPPCNGAAWYDRTTRRRDGDQIMNLGRRPSLGTSYMHDRLDNIFIMKPHKNFDMYK